MDLIPKFWPAHPILNMLTLDGGLSLMLCGYLGHIQPIRSGLTAAGAFLVALLAIGFYLLLFDFASAEVGEATVQFMVPLLGLLSILAPGLIFWRHLQQADQAPQAPRLISKKLTPLIFIAGLLSAGLSLPGARRYLEWFF